MKIYVVNLKRRTDRKEFMISQFEKFGITNYEFVEAVDGKTLDLNEVGYSESKAARWCRPLTKSEIGCSLSHVKIYDKMVEDGLRGIILEDDTIITEEFSLVTRNDFEESMGLVMIGFSTSPGKHMITNPELTSNFAGFLGSPQTCYFKKENISVGNTVFHKMDEHSYKNNYLIGTYAYSPSLEQCKIFSLFNKKAIVPADFVWNMIHHTRTEIDVWAPLKPIAFPKSDESDIQLERQHVAYTLSPLASR